MRLIDEKYFSESVPQNAKNATATIGSGVNGTVTITIDQAGADGNDYTIEVKAGSGNDVALSATLNGKDIVVTLGTDGTGALDATKNTASLVASAINALSGVSATASGDGSTALSSAEAKKNFTGGQYGTEAYDSVMFIDETNNAIYVCIGSNDKRGKNWRKIALVDY